MNIYIPTIIEDIKDLRNPYLWTLIDGIQNIDASLNFLFGYKLFWKNTYNYEIIHLMWPECLLEPNKTIEEFCCRLEKIRKKGIKVISTCHNLHTHCLQNQEGNIYDIMYEKSDLVIHMGDFSYTLLKRKFPFVNHIIIPHHVYDELYQPILDKRKCCKQIHINPLHSYVLCIGAFRSKEEKDLILKVEEQIKHTNIYILAPTFIERNKRRFLLKYIKFLIQIWQLKKKHSHLIIKGIPVTDSEMVYYYGASDLCLIQRLEILNSGNIPFALLMGKVVVGPNTGNVGKILKETGNVSFDPNDVNTVFPSIKMGLSLRKNGRGKANRDFALRELKTSIIARKLYNIYTTI